MTPRERATLAKLAQGAAPLNEMPREHVAKFLNHGLIARDVMRYRITAKGQLELLRQRYRDTTTRRKSSAKRPTRLDRSSLQSKDDGTPQADVDSDEANGTGEEAC